MLLLRKTDKQTGRPCQWLSKLVRRIVKRNGLEAGTNDIDLREIAQRECRSFQLRNALKIQRGADERKSETLGTAGAPARDKREAI